MPVKPKLPTIDATPVKKATSKEVVETSQTHDSKPQLVKKEKRPAKHRPSHHRSHGKVSNKVVVKKGDEIEYVARKEAEKRIEEGWSYGKKKEWKATKTA